jgi:hypothetical protein
VIQGTGFIIGCGRPLAKVASMTGRRSRGEMEARVFGR